MRGQRIVISLMVRSVGAMSCSPNRVAMPFGMLVGDGSVAPFENAERF
jgi:hypothetical protein